MADTANGNKLETKLYKRRWFILFLFVMLAIVSAIQWVEYCIITNIVERYYNVSSIAIDWTSLITMVTYPPLLIPGTYVIDKLGLRTAMVTGVLGTAIGTWIKVLSANPDLFWVTFLGQTVVFCSQIFILSVPPKLASVWFAEDEVSRACGIGVFGTQFGTALSFILPPLIVKNHKDLDLVGQELSYMYWGIAIFTTPIALLIFLFFQKEPPLPPSEAQAVERLKAHEFKLKDLYISYITIFTNKPFLIHTLAYGLNIGVFAALCTVLNQFVLSYFKDSAEDAGIIGLLMTVLGMIGSVLFGYILDKTRKYKEITLAVYIMTTIGVIAFMLSLETYSKPLVYLSGSIMGFFMNSYYPVGFEMAVELTFPEPESTSSGLLICAAQSFGITLIILNGYLLNIIGTSWVLIIMIILLCFGTVVTVLTPNILKRQEAFLTSKDTERIRFTPVPTDEEKIISNFNEK